MTVSSFEGLAIILAWAALGSLVFYIVLRWVWEPSYPYSAFLGVGIMIPFLFASSVTRWCLEDRRRRLSRKGRR